MAQKDILPIKEEIISIIRQRGPGLPVNIASITGSSTLFVSAFLSELVSERILKISKMKVGNSPLYFLPGQETMLERFVHHLKGKEIEAFEILKEKKFVKDSGQDLAIRVALRAIRDFAIPFKKNEEIYWRFHTVPEDNFNLQTQSIKEIKKPIVEKIIKKDEDKLGIFEKEEKKVPKKKKPTKYKKELFFNQIKKYFDGEKISIKDILKMGENYIALLVEEKGKEKIVVAFNKTKISENDIKIASKKAKERNLSYILLSKGEPFKKIMDLIENLKNLSEFRKIE